MIVSDKVYPKKRVSDKCPISIGLRFVEMITVALYPFPRRSHYAKSAAALGKRRSQRLAGNSWTMTSNLHRSFSTGNEYTPM